MTKAMTTPISARVSKHTKAINHLSSSCVEQSFISKGYTNWKNATVNFRCHESSHGHKDAVLKTQTLPHTTKDIGESLSQIHAQEKKERRQCF